MKYKIVKSDLLLKGKIIPENTEIELSDNEIIGLEDYLELCLSAEVLTKAETSVKADNPEPVGESLKIKQESKTKRGNK